MKIIPLFGCACFGCACFGCACFDCVCFDCACFDCVCFDCACFDCVCFGLASFQIRLVPAAPIASHSARAPCLWLRHVTVPGLFLLCFQALFDPVHCLARKPFCRPSFLFSLSACLTWILVTLRRRKANSPQMPSLRHPSLCARLLLQRPLSNQPSQHHLQPPKVRRSHHWLNLLHPRLLFHPKPPLWPAIPTNLPLLPFLFLLPRPYCRLRVPSLPLLPLVLLCLTLVLFSPISARRVRIEARMPSV